MGLRTPSTIGANVLPTTASPVGLGLPLGLPRKVHDGPPELDKLLACQWFGHIISVHFISWAVLNQNITLLDLIRNEGRRNGC